MMASEDRDITNCYICVDVLQDPKILPCIHTFCMNYLQETGLKSNKGPGDQMPCPICRRLFTIPKGGFTDLPNNTFLERIITVRKLLNPSLSTALCEACTEETKSDSTKDVCVADIYCVDCRQKFCESCSKDHRKFKLTKNHKLISLSEHDSNDVGSMDLLAPLVCEVHQQAKLNMYCSDCREVVCNICFIERHRNHDGSQIDTITDQCRKHIEECVTKTDDWRLRAQAMNAELDLEKQDLDQKTRDVANEILQRKEELQVMVNKNVCLQMTKLDALKHERLKEVQIEIEENELYLICLESYSRYCKSVLTKGAASDICRASGDLFERAVELENEMRRVCDRKLRPFDISAVEQVLIEFLEQDNASNVGGVKGANAAFLADTLGPELENERRYNRQLHANTDILQQELENKNLIISQLNTRIDALKKELEIEKLSQGELKTICDRLKKEIEEEKMSNRNLHVNSDILLQKLERNKLRIINLQTEREEIEVVNDKLQQDVNEQNLAISHLYAIRESLQTEFDTEKVRYDELRRNSDRLLQELDKEKIDNKELREYSDRLLKELDKEKSDNKELRESSDRLLQELDKEKIDNKELRENSDRLQQELDKQKIDNKELRENSDRILQELDKQKIDNKELRENSDRLQQELDKEKIDNKELRENSDRLQQELDKEKIDNKELRKNSDRLQHELESNSLTIGILDTSRLSIQTELEHEKLRNKELTAAINILQQELANVRVSSKQCRSTGVQHEPDNLKMNNTLLLQEVDNTISNSMETKKSNNTLQQELDKEKMLNEQLQASVDSLRQELEKERSNRHQIRARLDKFQLKVNNCERGSLHLETNTDKSDENSSKLTHQSQANRQNIQEEQERETPTLQQEKTSIRAYEASSGGRTVETLKTQYFTDGGSHVNSNDLHQDQDKQNSHQENSYKWPPLLVKLIQTKAAEYEKKGINGVTILDNELFVISNESSEIEVYNSTQLYFSRRFHLRDLVGPVDVVSCAKNKCLYIMDAKVSGQSKEILRLSPKGKLLQQWSTECDGWGRLSVTAEKNVLLTVYQKNKLNEYSPQGELVREIKLDPRSCTGIRHPWHAIKLASGNYLVSHGFESYDQHRVCIVDVEGNVTKSFGRSSGMTSNRMYAPVYLAIDKNGFVMVADRCNDRVLLLDASLKYVKELITAQNGLRQPRRILLDEVNGRLIVADNEWDSEKDVYVDGQILVFEIARK